jgi:hypothetical protein
MCRTPSPMSGPWVRSSRVGRPELERSVRLVAVVQLAEDATHPPEMAVDDQPIQTLRARGADEAARPRVASEATRRERELRTRFKLELFL